MHLVWLRNDLRLADHPALFSACAQAIHEGSRVLAFFCATPLQWARQGDSNAKLSLLQDALNDLQPRLAALGIPLQLLHARDFDNCANVIGELVKETGAKHLWMHREIPVWESARDASVSSVVETLGCEVHCLEGDLLVEPQQLLNQQGDYYKVFTPWHRQWQQRLDHCRNLLPEPAAVAPSIPITSAIDLGIAVTHRSDLWPATESLAQKKLQQFAQRKMHHYLSQRDFPCINGTSALSPYFAIGMITARQCLQAVQQQQGEWRSDPWLREVAWREFYRYLMFGFPRLSKNQPFKPETQWLQWEHNPELVQAWQQGKTGYPIVDAAMRQMLQTGWMHNRLRMITASFFTKLMLEHWQLGERYFMEQLIDGDFPSNNGGWQWSASTGCDASPWFRVFNPQTQSEKFDSDGEFIRRFVPELASIQGKSIHNPSAAQRSKLGYPLPIVEYKGARERVLARFKALSDMPQPS